MDHSVSTPELVRPWRTATLVATAIAGLELVLLIVAGMVLLGKSLAPQVRSAAADHARAAKQKPVATKTRTAHAAKPDRPPRAAAELPRAKTGVLVLNGNGVQGAAAQTASLVRSRGYPVKAVGNAPRSGYPKTIVEYRPGFAGEAKRFAHDFGLGVVAPLDGMKPARLRGARIVVILGASR